MARYVGLLRHTAKIHQELSIGILELDQARQDPEIAGALGCDDAHRAGDVRRSRSATNDVLAEPVHLLDIEK